MFRCRRAVALAPVGATGLSGSTRGVKRTTDPYGSENHA